MTRLLGWNLALVLAAAGGLRAAPPDYQVTKKITLGGDGGWDYLTVDPAAQRLYIARANRVMVVDLDQGKLAGEVPNCPGIHGVALVPEKNRGYSSNGQEASVTVFDLQTLKETNRVKVGQRPDAIIYDPASKRVFTMNAGSKDATAIDVDTEQVAGTVPLEGRPEFAVADGAGQVFVNLEDKSEIVAFDSRKLAVSNHWTLAPGKGPAGLAMDRKHRRLFSTCANEKMIVMDADNGRILATLTIGKGTDAAAFDPEHELAFSSNRDGTLTVVHEDDPEHFSAVSNVKTPEGARTMALDPKTHNIYLVTAKSKPAPENEPKTKGQRQRRGFEPGSFVVVVVGPKS